MSDRRSTDRPGGDRLTLANLLPTLAPGAIADILGDRLPGRVTRAFRRFRYGPGAFKVDFAVDGGVPWTNRDAHEAGTVHVGGDFAEIAATERAIHAGRMPDRPFVLVGQQYLADPERWVGDTRYGRMPMSRKAIRVMPPRRSSRRSSGSRRGSGTALSGWRSVRRPRWRFTTPTMSAGTS